MPEPTVLASAAQDDSLRASVISFIFGLIGSIISLRWSPQMGLAAKLSGILSGAFIAMFATPLFKYLSGVTDSSTLYGVAGLIGIFGLAITAQIFDTVRGTKWGRIIERRLGGESPPPNPSEGA